MKPEPRPIDAARAAILRAMVPQDGAETIPLLQAMGRVAARDVLAPGDQPRFNAAAMDGWAVGAQAPVWRLVGESRAGAAYGAALAAGEAVAISTGAVVPEGTLALIRREQGREEAGHLLFTDAVPGRDIRPQGCDFHAGDVLLPAGRVIDHLDVARVAAAGIAELPLVPLLRVAMLATGDEITPGGARVKPDGTFDALSPAIRTRLAARGIVTEHLGVARDAEGDIAGHLSASKARALIVIGGASGGRHDRVRDALAGDGLDLVVHGVMMRPGKPFWCGHLSGGRFVFGLPGNPVAALAALELFVLPALARMAGETPAEPTWIALEPQAPGEAVYERLRFARWGLDADGRLQAEALGHDDSAALAPLAGANGLIRMRVDGTARRLLRLDLGGRCVM